MKRLLKTKFFVTIIHKLNLFDLLILTAIIVVLGFLMYNRLQRKSHWINVRISVENVDWWYQGTPPYYWYASNLKAGDISYDSFGKKVAEVIRVENYDFGGPHRNIYVDLKVKVVFDKKRQQYLYEFKPLVVGSITNFYFSAEQLRGLVIRLNEEEIPYISKTITIQKKLVIPEMADKIKVGDKSSDTNHNVVAEIIDVENSISSTYEFSDIRGGNIKTYDPDYRDVKITMRIKTFRDLDRNFYVNQAVIKVGSIIWLHFPDYPLEDFEIIEILD